jgi:putative DNA primase/helicase
MHTPAETLMSRAKGGGIPNDLARLRGARFVTAVETDVGRRMAESLVKQMTGGDTVTARFLHREFFEFRPEFKLWLATNHKPIIHGTDYAIWRRIRLIPFTVTIPEEEREKDLGERLLEESAGILSWAVQGCLSWQKTGLREPQAVTTATADYREEMDPLADFLAERCVSGEGLMARTGELYVAFQKWADENGRHSVSSMAFSLRLQEKGFTRLKDRKGSYFCGLGLASKNEA